MTDEHLWLQGRLRDMCEELGYPARLEKDFADVRVDSPTPYALEVQRVSTDFSTRTAQRAERGMRTIWFLPETEKQRNTSQTRQGDPVFTAPAVRLRYYSSRGNHTTMLSTQYLQNNVWNGSGGRDVDLRVAVTVWEMTEDRQGFRRIDNNRAIDMDLKDFLQEVLSGERRWFSKQLLHGRTARGKWAGWAKVRDVEEVHETRARRARNAERSRDQAAKQTREEEVRRRASEEERQHELTQDPEEARVVEQPTAPIGSAPQSAELPTESAPHPDTPTDPPLPWWKRFLRWISAG
ncbi:hypothetical protein [Nesterenkonia halobia]|uniref:Restriction endonuclease n=1 Tax=Nesterenkonia halobia TaxID=37922 RepID=A0ABP6RHC1_9MICC